MKVTEKITKEFDPYKISIENSGDRFRIKYFTRSVFMDIPETKRHTENFKTIDEAITRLNEVVKEIAK